MLWIVAAVALHLPQSQTVRAQARDSAVLSRLIDVFPPQRVMKALSRVDPFPLIVGPDAPSEPPDSQLIHLAAVRAAEPSIVKVISEACGLGYAGSGWVVRQQLVVTAAHVVAGSDDLAVEPQGHRALRARVVAFDGRNDLAILYVPSLDERPLATQLPQSGDAAVVLGFPGDGAFSAEPARIGSSATLFAPDYAHQIVSRSITSLRGDIRRGNSGGPVVNARGVVELTVFGARKGSDVGYGVSSELVRNLLVTIDLDGVSPGRCIK
jgi:S1-C subfamily serine protease